MKNQDLFGITFIFIFKNKNMEIVTRSLVPVSYFIFSNNVRTKNSIKKVTNINNNNNKDRSIQKYTESYFKFLGYNFPVT